MTGWPDEMVEDYIQILSDLVVFANEINQNTQDIQEAAAEIQNTNSDVAGARGLFAKNKAAINSLSKAITDLVESVTGPSTAKLRSGLSKSIFDYRAWMPVKGCQFVIEGQGASNPLLTNAYNITSITRTGVGVYLATVTQETFFTRNVLNSCVFAETHKIASTANSYDVEISVTGATTFEARVYKSVVSGVAVQRSAYDLVAGDVVHVNGLFSINNTLPPG